MVTRGTLLPLLVLVYPLVVLVFPLAVLICPLVVLVCSLVVSAYPLVVLVVISVCLFITDQKLLGGMSFIKRFLIKCVCIQMFMTRYLLLKISENKKKLGVPDTYYISNDCTNFKKFMKIH